MSNDANAQKRKEQIKKRLVYSGTVLLCLVSFYFIFKPSKEQVQAEQPADICRPGGTLGEVIRACSEVYARRYCYNLRGRSRGGGDNDTKRKVKGCSRRSCVKARGVGTRSACKRLGDDSTDGTIRRRWLSHCGRRSTEADSTEYHQGVRAWRPDHHERSECAAQALGGDVCREVCTATKHPHHG